MAATKSESSCSGCGSAPAALSKGDRYANLVDRWWPANLPFPPMAPWLASGLPRARMLSMIQRFLPLLPDLPDTQDEELEAIARILFSYLGVNDSPASTGVVACFCPTGGGEPEEHANWNEECMTVPRECTTEAPYCLATTDSDGIATCVTECTADPACGQGDIGGGEAGPVQTLPG